MSTKNSKTWWRPVIVFTMLSVVFSLALVLFRLLNDKGQMVEWMAVERTPFLNQLFLGITRLGEEHVILAAIFISLFITYRKSALFSLAGILSLVISFIAKTIFSTPRPLAYFSTLGKPEVLGGIENYSFHSGLTSMPSGHTIAAFAFFTSLVFILKNTALQVIAFLLAAGVGISRIYLGQHFTEDVALGTIFGMMIGFISYYTVYIIWADRYRMDGSILTK